MRKLRATKIAYCTWRRRDRVRGKGTYKHCQQ